MVSTSAQGPTSPLNSQGNLREQSQTHSSQICPFPFPSTPHTARSSGSLFVSPLLALHTAPRLSGAVRQGADHDAFPGRGKTSSLLGQSRAGQRRASALRSRTAGRGRGSRDPEPARGRSLRAPLGTKRRGPTGSSTSPVRSARPGGRKTGRGVRGGERGGPARPG